MSEESPLILAVDTASSCSSISITRGTIVVGEVVATLCLNAKVTHSRRLLASIDWLLQESGLCLQDIDGFAVGLGPGSFTGLRIGMATAKGMATALDKPLLGVSSLDGLAVTCSGDGPLCALLDARKQQIYRRWYVKDSSGIYRASGEIAALSPVDFASEVVEPCQLLGDGVAVLGEKIKKDMEDMVDEVPLPLHVINAAAVGLLCCEQLLEDKMLDLDSAVPLYVRASDAELSLTKKP